MAERVTSDEIVEAAEVLRAGGLVALPTETVYGLGADAENPDAVARIFEVKGRPRSHPLIVHLGAGEQLDGWGIGVPEMAYELAECFWPGPLTLVVRRGSRVPAETAGGLPTVALRMPDHPVALALLSAFGGGIAAPSANRFGSVSPTTAADVRAELGDSVDLVLDGGPCQVGVESTIVQVLDDHPSILRPGGVTREELQTVLGRPVTVDAASDIRVPGQHPSHYAPHAHVTLVDAEDILATAEEAQAQGHQVGVLLPAHLAGATIGAHSVIVAPGSMANYARELYRTLRAFDQQGCDLVVAAPPPDAGLGLAIGNRLRRAAGPRTRPS